MSSSAAGSAAVLRLPRQRLPQQVFRGCCESPSLRRLQVPRPVFVSGGCVFGGIRIPLSVAVTTAADFRVRLLLLPQLVFGLGGCGSSSAAGLWPRRPRLPRLPRPVFVFVGCVVRGRSSSSAAVASAAGLWPWLPRLQRQVFIFGGCGFRSESSSSASAASAAGLRPRRLRAYMMPSANALQQPSTLG